jgi:hypothetical protein
MYFSCLGISSDEKAEKGVEMQLGINRSNSEIPRFCLK